MTITPAPIAWVAPAVVAPPIAWRPQLALGGKLRVFKGNPLEIIPTLAKATDAGLICWNRCYEPWRIASDTVLKAALEDLVLLCNP